MLSRVQAIRDGVIEASINHEKGFVQSKETMDIYGTREPQLAFHQRISFCLDIHNMSVKVTLTHSHTRTLARMRAPPHKTVCLPLQAMRFPPKAYNKDLESAEVRKEDDSGGPELDSLCGAFRNVGNVSSRIWSLPKRWLKMTTTASRSAPISTELTGVITQNSLLHAVLFCVNNKTPTFVFTSGFVGNVV